ncbi:MAG: TetR/AcrR family transcriptional regulator, partial [Microbacteriaceae bacterium]
ASRRKTQQRLREAAGAEFAENGYANATVIRIAARAGVTVQTLYLAWGSKRALLRAYMNSTLESNTGPHDQVGDRFAGMSPREVLEAVAALVGTVAGRSAIGWKLYRDAAATDPEIAEDWAELQRLRRGTFAAILRNIPVSALRSDLTPESAIDTAWAIASPDLYELLVHHASYSPDEFESWVAATLTATLLA